MCVQRRFKSVCASTQSDQSRSFPSEETLDHWLPIERQSQTQNSLRIRADWSESSMGAYANLYPLVVTGFQFMSAIILHLSLVLILIT